MKKHKMEIACLTLLLGVLCYAFYDCNIKDSSQEITLSSELLSMREIKNKEDITTEMLAIPTEDLLKLREEEKAKFNTLVNTKLGEKAYRQKYNIPDNIPISNYINDDPSFNVPDNVFYNFYNADTGYTGQYLLRV